MIGIMNSSRQVIAKYRYDAWGKLISMTDASGAALGENTIGARNPLRYRGYIYDSETGFYYLQSRYYDPVVHRFINADEQLNEKDGMLGYNMYAYCNNNPVIHADTDGRSLTLACIIGFAALGALIGGLYGSHRANVNGYSTSDGWNYWRYVLGYGAGGGAAGALVGWGVGAAATAMTATTWGTLGKTIYSSWQAAEQGLRNAYRGIKRSLETPMGRRIVDSFSKRVIREAKYGYQGLSQFIQREIDKDVWLLNNTDIKRVEWHFYWSQVSNTGGLSAPLRNELLRHGIKIVFH